MPIKLCTTPGCPNRPVRRGRCPDHNPRTSPRKRELKVAVYNRARWQNVRVRQLFDHPLCARCGEVATDVHHRQDLADGGDPWDSRQLESLCKSCHSRHTRSQM